LTGDRRNLIYVLLVLALAGVIGYAYFGTTLIQGAVAGGTNSAEANTPFGESIEITIGSGTETSGTASLWDKSQLASWLASYSDSDSQNVYQVNGTYKSQEQVTLSYSLSVTHSNVEDIHATVKIKAVDKSDNSNHEYTLASSKSLSGSSPISDSGSTQKTIAQHLTDVDASLTSATVKYEVYCQVTATGSISGETLTATISYTPFGCLQYQRSSESSEANVTPSVSVSSWLDDYLGLPGETVLNFFALASLLSAYIVWRRYPCP